VKSTISDMRWHGYLMSEHDDLNCELGVLRAEELEQLDESNERQVEEGQRHGPVSTRASCRRKPS